MGTVRISYSRIRVFLSKKDTRYVKIFQEPYSSTVHLRNSRKAGPGWISYLRTGVFYTNFSITAAEFVVPVNLSLPFFLLVLLFGVLCPVLCSSKIKKIFLYLHQNILALPGW